MNDETKNVILNIMILFYFLLVYIIGFSGSYSHRNTFLGKLNKKFLSIFNIVGFSLIPPLTYLILYIWNTYVYFDIVNRVLSQLTTYEDLVTKISIICVPISMIFFLLTIIIPPTYENNESPQYSYLNLSFITKRNFIFYIIFLLSTLFTFTFHLVFVVKYLIWRIHYTLNEKFIESAPFHKLFKLSTIVLLRNEPELMSCALRSLPICIYLFVQIIDQIYLKIHHKNNKMNNKND